MMRFAVSVVVVGLLAAASDAAAQDSQAARAVRDRVMGLLVAYEHVPSAEEIASLGDGAQEALIDVALDESQAPFVRGRAVWALGFFPNAATRGTIEGLLDIEDLDDMILRRALAALARAFGPQAVGRIRPYLDDRRPEVRETAARALGQAGGEEALRALQRRVGRERTEAVREALGEEIRRIERARGPDES